MVGARGFAGLDRDNVLVAFAGGLLAIDGHPAGIDDDLAVRLEGLALDARDARGDFELRRRIEHRDEAPRDHVVDLQLEIIEVLRRHAGGHDGMVIRHLRVVEHALRLRVHPTLGERLLRVRGEAWILELREPRLHLAEVVLRQVTRVGSRIGEHLVLLVKRLRELERAAALRPKRLFASRWSVVRS